MASEEGLRLEREFLSKSTGKEKPATLRKEMHDCMETGAGIYRTEASLKASQDKILELQERFKNIKIEDSSKTFNTGLIAALELSYLLDLAEAIVQSALHRKESRGSHQRTDFPNRDDENYLAHSLAFKKPGDVPDVKYTPVTITKWPPGERIYGR